MTTLTIGRLARAAGVNLETIRYYQRRGLLATPPRPQGGVRRYPPEALARLRFIKRAQQLGFTLREVRELLVLGSGRCTDTRRIAEVQLEQIEARLHDLQRMRRSLRKLITACRAGQDTACPIVETLSRDERARK
jgi:MerR family mercuric resistance operon transcriptional regulator